jgi:hypothetical protein
MATATQNATTTEQLHATLHCNTTDHSRRPTAHRLDTVAYRQSVDLPTGVMVDHVIPGTDFRAD